MKIALLGDIALFGAYDVNRNPSLLNNLNGISNYLSHFDCVVGNLETPFSIKQKTSGAKSAYICADVENIEVLRKIHLSAALLANNHMFDYGEEGYQCTIDTLTNAGIPYFGVDGKEFIFDKNGNKILFSGFCCYSSNPLNLAYQYGKHGVNSYNVKTVSDYLKDHKDYLNIVAVHAGIEHVNCPHPDHIKAARKLSEITPYIYYGHHPHVVQGIEEKNDSLIAYSLGNFCFDDIYSKDKEDIPFVKLTDNNRTGMILELMVENNLVVSWRQQMIKIGKSGYIELLEDKERKFDKYSDQILEADTDEVTYLEKRNAIIAERIASRKSMRNLAWYLKRLRPQYVKLIFDMRKNQKNYFNNVKKYI